MNEQSLKLEFRLAAIEHMLANVYKMVYLMSGATPQMIAESLDKFQQSVIAERIPGLDPVQSDLVSAELELAYKHLLDAIRETAGAAKKSQQNSRFVIGHFCLLRIRFFFEATVGF